MIFTLFETCYSWELCAYLIDKIIIRWKQNIKLVVNYSYKKDYLCFSLKYIPNHKIYANTIVLIMLVAVIMFVSRLDILVHVLMSTPLKENKINVKWHGNTCNKSSGVPTKYNLGEKITENHITITEKMIAWMDEI